MQYGNPVPQISSKDLSMIEDQLSHEALAYKKCQAYAGYFMDTNAQNLANQLAQHHKQNFTNLLDYLNSHQ